MFIRKNKKQVIKNYGNYRVIKSSLNDKYYVQKKVPDKIVFFRWMTICISQKNAESAMVIALVGECKLTCNF
jgi:hypothetical protein